MGIGYDPWHGDEVPDEKESVFMRQRRLEASGWQAGQIIIRNSPKRTKLPWYKRFAERERAASRNRLIYDREGKSLYLERFYIVKRKYTLGLFNVCLHRFVRSDDPEDGIHDHPWPWFTYILEGGYEEYRQGGIITVRTPGCWRLALPTARHRIELLEGSSPETETWTLFIMGPRVRDWFFYIPNELGWYTKWGWKEWIAHRAPGKKADACGND